MPNRRCHHQLRKATKPRMKSELWEKRTDDVSPGGERSGAAEKPWLSLVEKR